MDAKKANRKVMAPPSPEQSYSFLTSPSRDSMESESAGEISARKSRNATASSDRSASDDDRNNSVETQAERHTERANKRNQELNSQKNHPDQLMEEEDVTAEASRRSGATGMDFHELLLDPSSDELDEMPIAELRRAAASRVTDSEQSFEGRKKLPGRKDDAELSEYARMPAKEKKNDYHDNSKFDDRKMPAKDSFNHEKSDSEDSSLDGYNPLSSQSMIRTKETKRWRVSNGRDNEVTAGSGANGPVQDKQLPSQGGPKDGNLDSMDREANSDESESDEEEDVRPAGVTLARDGTYIAPRGGMRPKGKVWDKYKGEYVSKRKRTNDASHLPSRRNLSNKRPKANIAPKRPPSKQAPQMRDREQRKRNTEIGTHVYAKFTDGYYYWGVVTAIKRKPNSHFDQYSIIFHDNDELDYVSLQDFYTLDEYQHSPELRSVVEHEPPKRLTKKQARIIRELQGAPLTTTTASSKDSNLDIEEIFARRCKNCPNCVKEDCGRCASCMSNKNSNDPIKVCLQKMCCEIPVEERAQPMPRCANFPSGCTFVVDPLYEIPIERKCPSPVNGLKIFHPGGNISYYSVENAMGHLKFNGSPEEFYKFIGASSFSKTSQSVTTAAPRPPPTSHDTRMEACGRCENCTKDECGQCQQCKLGRTCFQKMCFEQPPDVKAKPAKGLDKGWKFYFDKPRITKPSSPYEQIPSLWILSPGGKKYRSIEAIVKSKGLSDGERIAQEFYRHVGLSWPREPREDRVSSQTLVSSHRHAVSHTGSTSDDTVVNNNNFLVGRTVSFVWLDTTGRQKAVYGTVTEYRELVESGDAYSWKVKYNENSRALATTNEYMSRVPESQTFLRPELLIGGCIRYQEQCPGLNTPLLDPPFCWNWISPIARREEMVPGNGGQYPRLTILVRGFQLVFDVKPSTIPDAGAGVFVRCMPVDGRDNEEPFVLQAGELVDLGIYAPCRPQDRKPAAVFDVKNFVHRYKCEEFGFDDAMDSDLSFDITEDVSGELHKIAKGLIHPYVNESENEEDVCINAEHDAENCIHYLLGHATESQGEFVLPCNQDHEVFVNYGQGYEKNRVRHGYSSLPQDEQDLILEELETEPVSDIENMDNFDAHEIEAAVNFLRMFEREEPSKFEDSVVGRGLVCATVLCRRTKLLLMEAPGDSSLRRLLKRCYDLVTFIVYMPRDGHDELQILHGRDDMDELMREVLRREFTDKQFDILNVMLDFS